MEDLKGQHKADQGRILIAGDIDGVFVSGQELSQTEYKICRSMLDAIDAAAKDRFKAIFVVMTGTTKTVQSILKSLREVNSSAKIILIAQIWQEPQARRLTGEKTNGLRLADDYLICPIEEVNLQRIIAGEQKPATIEFVHSYGDRARIEHLEKLATEDDLTGLKNRRYICEFAKQIIERAKNDGGRVMILMFDIDDFKHYNDVYGHGAGDEILRQAAILMKLSCRPHDVVGRIGGDEFAVVFWDDPKSKRHDTEQDRRSALKEHPKEILFIANRFRREIHKAVLPLLGPEGKGVLAISGGLASFPRDGTTVAELFEQADNALLDAKKSGKNRIYLVGKDQDDIAKI